jgi:hypothetical protein
MVAGRNWNVYAFDGAYPYLIDIYIWFTDVFVLLYQSVVSGIGCNLLNHFDVIVEYIYMGAQQHMRMSYCRVSLVSTHSELCPVQG